MVFCNEYDLGDIISIVSAVFILLGGLFTFIQWKKTVRIKRADYINELTEKIRSDKDIKNIIYLFEYGNEWYSRSFHGSGNLECQVDKTLSYFSYICYLRKQHIITKKEFMFFKYELEHLLMNHQVLDYLYNIYHYANSIGEPLTFYYLFEYGKNNHLFNTDFYDSNAWKRDTIYNRNLNF